MTRPKRYPYTPSQFEREEAIVFSDKHKIKKEYKLRNRFTGKIIHEWGEWENRNDD